MSNKSSGIPGVGAKKTFTHVASAPASERHIVVNVNDDVNVNQRYFEDSHKRQTVWMDIEIFQILQRNTVGRKGAKTQAVNDALRQYFRSKGWE